MYNLILFKFISRNIFIVIVNNKRELKIKIIINIIKFIKLILKFKNKKKKTRVSKKTMKKMILNIFIDKIIIIKKINSIKN